MLFSPDHWVKGGHRLWRSSESEKQRALVLEMEDGAPIRSSWPLGHLGRILPFSRARIPSANALCCHNENASVWNSRPSHLSASLLPEEDPEPRKDLCVGLWWWCGGGTGDGKKKQTQTKKTYVGMTVILEFLGNYIFICSLWQKMVETIRNLLHSSHETVQFYSINPNANY